MSELTRVEKPWGYELHWAKTDRYVGKILHITAVACPSNTIDR